MQTSRATVIDVGDPFAREEQAQAWLKDAGEDEFRSALFVLNRTIYASRIVTADPYTREITREQALVARVGYGAGEQVADGLWADARELLLTTARQRRIRVLQPQARLAAVLGGREAALACQELALRARLDLDQGRDREAALQVFVALDAALAELPSDPSAAVVEQRLAELRDQRDIVARAAQAALAGALDESNREAIAFTLTRIEAALRARAVALS